MITSADIFARAVSSTLARPAPPVALDVVECVVCLRRYGVFHPGAGVVVHEPGTPRAYQCRLPGTRGGRQR